ncbi:MAG: transglutaminase family protein [Verrucomicrobiota bacterium]
MLRTLILTTLFVLSSPSFGQWFIDGVDVNDPPEGMFGEEWVEMFLNGQKIGYIRTFFRREGDEVVTVERSYTRLGRDDTQIESSSVTRTREKIDGTPISMSVISREGPLTKKQEFTFEGNRVFVQTDDGFRSWENTFDLEPGYLISWSFVRKLALTPPSEGDIWEDKIYSPDLVLDRTLPVTTKFLGKEILNEDSSPVETLVAEQTLRIGFFPLTVSLWIGEDGRLVKANMPMGGIDILIVGSTKEQALADFADQDIFTESLIDLAIHLPQGSKSITFLLEAESGTIPPPPESANQTVTEKSVGAYEIHVVEGQLPDPSEGVTPVDPVYLEASKMVDFEDPAILELLAEENLDSLPFAEKVERLVEIADENISIKSLDLGFGSASQALALQEGDCTEHALLLTALCRAAGIPARGASGLVYTGEITWSPQMGYHMWTQVWNGEEWLDIDAAFSAARTEPIRILLSVTDLSEMSLAEDFFAIYQYFDRINLSVLAIDGEPVVEESG